MDSANINNIAYLLERRLPKENLELLKRIGGIADGLGVRLFLVGGTVRDLLLDIPILDLDLMVEGDAIPLAAVLTKELRGGMIARSQFGTVKIKVKKQTIDLATARKETYIRPGALPTVSPGSIVDDLARRDFSINSIACSISSKGWGTVLDPHRGREDIAAHIIRSMHPKSFQDDATRIMRAVRYEQRLGFQIKEETLELLKASLRYMETISGDRVRHELERIFEEERAIAILSRTAELGILSAIYPALDILKAHTIGDKVGQEPITEGNLTYLALLVYYLPEAQIPSFAQRLNLPSNWAKVAKDVAALKGVSRKLARRAIRPSQIYEYLKKVSAEALKGCALLTKSPVVKNRIELYLDELRHVKCELDGEDLLRMGAPQGPIIGRLLTELKHARLDKVVVNRKQEERLVKRRLTEYEE